MDIISGDAQSAGSAALPISYGQPVDPEWERENQELIGEFVIGAHTDLDAVKAKSAKDSRFANARFYKFDEAPIEAASHMGRQDIAHYLLGSGAPLTMHCAVMLGLRETAEAYLKRDARLAVRPGAHNIPMMFHAAFSGDIAITELLVEHGGGQDYTQALHAAAWKNHAEMAQWLIERGAELNRGDFQGRTPLALAVQLGCGEAERVLRGAGAGMETASDSPAG